MSNSQDNDRDHEPHDEEHGKVCRPVDFTVNNHRHESLHHTLSGAQIKEIDHVPLTDELFLDAECGDEVVSNEMTVLVRDGDKFHTMPSPQYGDGGTGLSAHVAEVLAAYSAEFVERDAQDRRLVLKGVPLPTGYSAAKANILIRIPPLYPESRPDMFWARPALTLATGQQPQATSLEQIDGDEWQRFSWHLAPNAWEPGISRLRDFVRAVLSRLHRVS
jgi:Prokaryotic E2 family E